jgi:ribosomal protein L7/L12
VTILMELNVNNHASRIVSVIDLRRNLAPFASEQFREIWVSMDSGEPRLCALMNTNVGWLMYLRHDDGDSGFSSRNLMYDESDTLGGLVFDGRYGTERHVPVISYRLSNGQEDDFPASWALPQSDIMSALEYFVQHQGRRSPLVSWHDDAVAEPSHQITQPKEKGEFTVVLQTVGGMKIDVVREVRSITGLGLKEAKDLVEAAPKNVIEGVTRHEAEKIKATLEEAGATVDIKFS